MPFEKQGNFTKKVTDLPDQPSPTYTASDIKSHFETPSNELKSTVNKLVDDLNSPQAAGKVGALNGVNTTNVQAELSRLQKDKASNSRVEITENRISTNENDISAIKTDVTDLTDEVDNQGQRIDNIVAGAGESNTEIVDARYDSVNEVTYGTLSDRLDKTTTDLAQRETEIADLQSNKMDKNTTDISVFQINKNAGKLDQTYMTDEFLQQMAGTTPINAVPEDKSLTIEKFAFPVLKGIPSKNLFNKGTITPDSYLGGTTGTIISSPGYFVSEYIELSEGQQGTISPVESLTRVSFYDANKTYLSRTEDGTSTFTAPANTAFIRIASKNDLLNSTQVELGGIATPFESYGAKLDPKTVTDEKILGIQKPFYTLNDVWVAWLNGEKFPITFFGDSTVAGFGTTGYQDGKTDGTETISPNSFCSKLQSLMREATSNSVLKVYNSGHSGRASEWATTILENVFGSGTAYSDTKMVGIGWGINDRGAYQEEKTYRNEFKQNIIEMIDWFYDHSIQPFLVTTQAAISPGVRSDLTTTPLRTAQHIDAIANEVKRELAKEYGLELIEMNRFTEQFLLYSSFSASTIIADKLHFGDIGHKYEGEFLFALINPFTIWVDSNIQIDYSSQSLTSGVAEDLLTLPESPTDSFKVYANYTKADTTNENIMTAWVFINSKSKMTLKAYRDSSPDTYVKVNGVTTSLTGAETLIGELELGLHKLEVFTGASATVDFKGFIIE
jgi:hypothetical protein